MHAGGRAVGTNSIRCLVGWLGLFDESDNNNSGDFYLSVCRRDHFFSSIHTQRPEARTAEVDLLKQIRHDNVVAFMGAF